MNVSNQFTVDSGHATLSECRITGRDGVAEGRITETALYLQSPGSSAGSVFSLLSRFKHF